MQTWSCRLCCKALNRGFLQFNGEKGTSIAATNLKNADVFVVVSVIIFTVVLCAKSLRVKNGTFHHNPNKNGTPFCAVCLHKAKDGERLRKLPRCNHCFHVECIDAWFEYRSTCPLCRNEVSRRGNQRGLFSYVLPFLKSLYSKMGNPLNIGSTYLRRT